jgi:sporulation protein YlmC with PRC-barrel domain
MKPSVRMIDQFGGVAGTAGPSANYISRRVLNPTIPSTFTGRSIMKLRYAITAATLLITSAAYAQGMMSSVPSSSKTVSDWYKQDVYNPSDSKIGKIDDVLVSDSGQVSALIVGVGGFLGAGEKDVAVPFTAVKWTNKDNKKYLTMSATKDELKSAQGLKYDSDKTAWVLAK